MTFQSYLDSIKTTFKHNFKGDVEYLTIPSFDDAGGIIHAFTTRKTGVSKGGFSSLNFSSNREVSKENILENYRIITDALGLSMADLVLDNYGHTPSVLHVTEDMRGSGPYQNHVLPTCDGLATEERELPLVTLHADCAPIFFYDPIKHVTVVCHAGWRGVVGGIVKNALNMMISEFNSDIKDILAGVGPCIRSCCFEIQADVESIFKKEFGDDSVVHRDGKMFGDIERGIALSFYQLGLPAENLTMAKECTYCNKDTYYSYRRQGKEGGAMASFVMLK